MKSGNFFSKGQPEKSSGDNNFTRIRKEKLLETLGSDNFRHRVVEYIGIVDNLSHEYRECKKLPSVDAQDNDPTQTDLFIWSARQSIRGQIKEANYRLNQLALLRDDLKMILDSCSPEPDLVRIRPEGPNHWDY